MPHNMFKCPSRLKQQGHKADLRVVCYCIGENSNLSTLYSPSHPKLPPSTHLIITLHTFLHTSCESPAGSLLCMIGGRGNVTWVLCFWSHSLSSSHGANAVLVSLEPDELNFTSASASYYPQLGIIPYTVYGAIVLYPIYHQVWPAHLHYGDLTRDERTLGHEHVC